MGDVDVRLSLYARDIDKYSRTWGVILEIYVTKTRESVFKNQIPVNCVFSLFLFHFFNLFIYYYFWLKDNVI